MSTPTSTAGSIITSLLNGIYGVLGAVAQDIVNYAPTIADVLIAVLVGTAVVKFGRQLANGLYDMISGFL
jgi:hypothetical protein